MTSLKLARMRAGLTQLELATRCGTTENKLCRIETGRSMPPPNLQDRLAAVLGIDRDEVFFCDGALKMAGGK